MLDKATGKEYILLKERIGELYKSEKEYTIVEEFKGAHLKGKKYQPPFQYFAHFSVEYPNVHTVVTGDYIKTDQGKVRTI